MIAIKQCRRFPTVSSVHQQENRSISYGILAAVSVFGLKTPFKLLKISCVNLCCRHSPGLEPQPPLSLVTSGFDSQQVKVIRQVGLCAICWEPFYLKL